jgi:4a-hydroxytetrahydrobiopterin dehydratase
MGNLERQACTACREDSPAATDLEIAQFLPEISNWSLEIKRKGRQLSRVYRFRNFLKALQFTEAVGAMSELEGHHPRIVTEWGRVAISWRTHSIQDIHRNDFIMAARTDQLFLQKIG